MRLLFLSVFLAAAPFVFTDTRAEIATAIIAPEVNKKLLDGVVTKNILDYARLEVATSSNFQVNKDGYGNYLSLIAYTGQPTKYGAVSSELAVDYPYKEGETVRYTWRMKLPVDFIPDFPANRWWLLARWNDQPNVKFGEKQTDTINHNPAIMLGYKQVEGKDMIAMSYGVPDTLVAGSFKIRRGEWNKFVMDITWSRTDQGKAILHVNDSKLPIFEVTGRNMYKKYQHLFRTGIYRSSEINNNTYVQVGGVSIEILPQ